MTVSSSYVILRDGSSALVRPSEQRDRLDLQAFVDRLSPQSRRHRFFSSGAVPPAIIDALCDSSDPARRLTLLVTRGAPGRSTVIAAGSHLAKDRRTAEVAVAVDDEFHGKGLGTLLVERLALAATQQGFTRLWAVTHADNKPMREVFRESGFETTERFAGDMMEVELDLWSLESAQAKADWRERVATAASLRPLLRPRSVAVVGASRNPAGIGHRLLRLLVQGGFTGQIYAVNPHAKELLGVPVFASVRALPKPVDLAVLVVPRDAVLPVVDDSAARGVRALVVITAGFAEVGADGRALQEQLVAKVRQSGMRMVGPNCLGLQNGDPAVRLNASFSPVFPANGRVALSSESGALGLAVLSAAARLRLGLSNFVSVGNRADVSSNDLLQYWAADDGTDVVLLYLESFGNPRRFARIARQVARQKPIVAMKAGRTPAGTRAAGSHTAALVAPDSAVDALFHQTGVIRAETLEEMLNLAAVLVHQPLPAGARVGIVTNAGGPAILCADACERGGLHVPELSDALKQALRGLVPTAASLKNPVDLIASAGPEDYRRALDVVLRSGEVDALIVLYVSVGLVDTEAMSAAIVQGVSGGRAGSAARKPVLACWMTTEEQPPPAMLGESIPVFRFPEVPACLLSKTALYRAWRVRDLGTVPEFPDVDRERIRRLCRAAAGSSGWLGADETRSLLHLLGAALPPGGLATNEEEAVRLAEGVGFPVAVKLASRTIVHKTEAGGVALHLRDAAAVREAWKTMHDRLAAAGRAAEMDGVIVQPMLSGGVEVMIGVTHDPVFGPIVAFGLGGIHVEILGDVRFRVTPLTDRDAAEIVREIKGYRLLEGYRGHPPADLAALEDLLLRISHLVEAVPEILELDLNPVFALAPGRGALVVDARIRVETQDRRAG